MEHFGREIRRSHPRIKPDHTPSWSTREALEGFAIAAGMMTSLVGRATSTDLIGVYLVGDKDALAAQRMIRAIEKRMNNGSNPLWEPTEPREPVPVPPRTPDPIRPGMGFSASEIDAIRDIVDSSLTSTLSASLDTFGDAIKRDVDHKLEIADAGFKATLDNAIGGMAATIRQEAHTAAQEALKSLTPTVLEIKTPNAPKNISLGKCHKLTPRIIKLLSRGHNVYLYGPAGSGKTTMGQKCADAFGLEFYFCGKLDSEFGLLGFIDGNGRTIRTAFREAFEHGGLFLFDELDRSDAAAVVAMNAALANGVCAFPDGIVKRHENFKCIAAGNTVMGGATQLYQAAMQQDASATDRFGFVHFGYDEELERSIATNLDWANYVIAIRHAIARRELPHLVTPRATIQGCIDLAEGDDWDEVADTWIFKGLERELVEQLKSEVH